jgi:ArsR family transcriptional regulator
MKDVVGLFKILSDENRMRILLMLRIRPLCVCEIFEVLNIALSTLSQHLKTIKSAGLITDAKEGRWVIYTLNLQKDFDKEIIDLMERELQNDRIILNDRKTILTINRDICSEKLRS